MILSMPCARVAACPAKVLCVPACPRPRLPIGPISWKSEAEWNARRLSARVPTASPFPRRPSPEGDPGAIGPGHDVELNIGIIMQPRQQPVFRKQLRHGDHEFSD